MNIRINSLNSWGMPDQKIPLLLSVLCHLSGEDTRIIIDDEVNEDVARQFAGIGFLALVIFVLSFYSSVHFLVNLLNGSYPVALAVGLFWGAMIANIYYLLLFTITPPMLKGREHAVHGVPAVVTAEKKGLSRLSLGFRLLFVILLAVVIAQPWLVTIFDTSQWIEQERRAYRVEFARLAAKVESDENAVGQEDSMTGDRREIDRLLAANNFYTRKIQLIHRHYPGAWVVTGIVVLFFILPIGLKYRIRNGSNFYRVKREVEESLVLARYAHFKSRHAAIFASRYGIITDWYESCTDAPFNTRRKGEDQCRDGQQMLLDKIYPTGKDSEGNKYLAGETIS